MEGTKTITEVTAYAASRKGKKNNGVILKNFAPFTDCMSEINNTQVNNAKHLDVFIPV